MQEGLIKKYNELLESFRQCVKNRVELEIPNGMGGSLIVKSVVKVDFKGHLMCYVASVTGEKFDLTNLSKFDFAKRD
jgi:hypothetical protein